MHLVSCEHPQRVWNKYIQQFVWVPCKKCDTCRKRYQARWCSRLEAERKSSLFTLFVTLTYDESNLPRLVRCTKFDVTTGKDIECYKDKRDSFCIPFNDFDFETPADLKYFNDKMRFGGVPYPDFRDVQLFLKRFNKYIKTHYTQHYENFRYFICAELGKESLRPHYHGLFFFRSECPSSNLAEDISACWKLGSCKTEYVESTASSYVSKYVGKPSFYPSFYGHCKISPKFICSKRPPLGSVYELQKSSAEIFHDAALHVPCSSNDSSNVRLVSLPSYVENRLFPKCPSYFGISHFSRVALYGCASLFQGKGSKTFQKGKCGQPLVIHSFNDWLWSLRQLYFRHPSESDIKYLRYYNRMHTDIFYMLYSIADGFSEAGVNALRRLYYMSKRVLKQCVEFGVSINKYVSKIEEYFDKKEYHILTLFYDFQHEYAKKNNSEELINMYSEFSFQNPSDLPSLEDCKDYQAMKEDNRISQFLSLFSHFKNAFIDSCRCKDLQSKKLTLNFYYAKKCNEVIEAVT